MFKFLFSIFAFAALMIFIVVAYFIWMFWKMRRRMKDLSERAAEQRRQRERARRGEDMDVRQGTSSQQKIFGDDEGEYVEFEEEQ